MNPIALINRRTDLTTDFRCRSRREEAQHCAQLETDQSLLTSAPTIIEADLNDNQRILAAVLAILAQGEDLLCVLSVENYTRRVPLAFNGCIGGHYRHCLDHFTSLLRGLNRHEVDYDHRDRDARIESQPEFALHLTRQIRARFERIPLSFLDGPVRARCEVSYAHGDSPVTGSTFGREIVYAIAHAIHHYALISVMARLMEVELPEHFGVAPSTVAHEKANSGSGLCRSRREEAHSYPNQMKAS